MIQKPLIGRQCKPEVTRVSKLIFSLTVLDIFCITIHTEYLLLCTCCCSLIKRIFIPQTCQPALTSGVRGGKKTAHHSLAYPDSRDIRKLLMFSLALSPIIVLSFYFCILRCKSRSPGVWQVMFLALISISEVKGRDDIFCPAAVTVTYMLPVQDGTLLRGPPSLSSKLIMNQSV